MGDTIDYYDCCDSERLQHETIVDAIETTGGDVTNAADFSDDDDGPADGGASAPAGNNRF